MILTGSIVFCSLNLVAWTVPERIVEFPQETPQLSDASVRGKIIVKPIEPKALFETGYLQDPIEVVSNRQVKKEEFVFQKTPSKLSSEEKNLVEYRRALQYLRSGDDFQAEKLLVSILNQTPNYHSARNELATLYLKQNELDEGENVLLEGLKLEGSHPSFLRLMAVVHDRRQEPDKALALLVRIPDSRKKDKSYVAFLGHIYQQMGQYGLARQQYYRLLQAEPQNPLWLLGVSIALDSEGQHSAALEGYRRLTSEGNVDPNILQYARDRIRFLKG